MQVEDSPDGIPNGSSDTVAAHVAADTVATHSGSSDTVAAHCGSAQSGSSD
jgi:hypothetical protein